MTQNLKNATTHSKVDYYKNRDIFILIKSRIGARVSKISQLLLVII